MSLNNFNDEVFYSFVGKTVKTFRDKKDITQEALALLSGVKRSTIANIETGRQKIPLHVLVKICHALEIDLSDLIPNIEQFFNKKMSNVSYITIGDQTKAVDTAFETALINAMKELG